MWLWTHIRTLILSLQQGQKKIDRVFYNCGHGHYGLTHAATSANLLCSLIEGEQNSAEIKALSIDRFL